MGFCSPIKKSTLAEANERRNWRIWADLAAVLIRRARKIYIEEDLGLDLKTYRSDGKTHDTKVLDMLVFEPGAFYMMDRGYMDLQRLSRLHQAGAFYVTRAKDNLRARRVYSAPTDRSTGVISDQRVMLEGFYSIQDYPEHMRRIRFNDPITGQILIFLTNNTSLPALPPPSQPCTRTAGRSNSTSNGSSNTCASSTFWAQGRTL